MTLGWAMDAMNYARARYNMIEQQIRPWSVLDPAVLRALHDVPRERFVPAGYERLAYSDTRVPLAHGQSMMAPVVEGRLLQALELGGDEHVLEIGTGSGFLTACLARLARSVESVDLYADFTSAAGPRLQALGHDNVYLVTDDGARGWQGAHAYDAIALTGAVAEVPEAYRRALAPGGRLFAIRGEADQPIMEALQITRVGTEEWSTESLFETWIPPLVNAQRAPRFEF
jgi:protein-L-isoaspartate(D-aspartate) O-methyltransferase